MASGQQKAKKNLETFLSWSAAQDDRSFSQIVYRGQLNRNEIAIACGFAKSALRQNPAITNELKKLEDDLRERNILPCRSIERIEKEKRPKELDQSASGNALNKRRLSKLEQENMELHAKVRELELKLAKYSELCNVISELGMMPR
jgi:hypothetical protein